jgi:hypothetical protein
MANYAIQLRRGTSAEHSSFTGLVGEITVNTSNSSIHVHDGSTAGGTELATKASVDNLSSDTITDADSDTHVKVEASADSDTVAITAGGTNVMNATASGIAVTGTISATSTITGDLTGDVTGATTGAHNGTVGATTPSTGAFTSVTTSGALTVGGDLTVSGTTTTVNTETINLADNTIVLNSNATGSATEDAGIEIERGDDTNVSFLWDETNDRWTFADKNVFTSGEFQGTATSAQCADLAERYHAGSPIEAGSVVCFGGDNEIEMCNEAGSTRVAGVISTAPAYMMNRDAGDDSTHPYVALAGRVPCKVTGSIRKGDLLHSSAMAGHAMAGEFKGGAMIGKALENFDGESGVIEVLVNLM